MFSCFKRADKREVKVAQLAGAVGELSAYHHGEASLMSTIVNLAHVSSFLDHLLKFLFRTSLAQTTSTFFCRSVNSVLVCKEAKTAPVLVTSSQNSVHFLDTFIP